MRFLADMGISPRTVDFLRDAGHDAVHLVERGLNELGDPEILKLGVCRTFSAESGIFG